MRIQEEQNLPIQESLLSTVTALTAYRTEDPYLKAYPVDNQRDWVKLFGPYPPLG